MTDHDHTVKKLLVQEGSGGPFGVHAALPAYREATNDEVVAKVLTMKGATPSRYCFVHDHAHPGSIDEAIEFSLNQEKSCRYVRVAIVPYPGELSG